MSNQKKICNPKIDMALVAKALATLGKPAAPHEIAAQMRKMFKTPAYTFTVQSTLKTYEPLGYFKREGELYSVPSELLSIVNGDRGGDAKPEVLIQRLANPEKEEEETVVYGVPPIDPSQSLRHPYLYQYK